MNKNPLVSVVISCYNCEKYVELAVQSIIDQTYTNLEILITDDCSQDNTYNLLKQLAEKDNRIILFKNESNLKLAKNLNNMIAVAKGKYIARMDADDISLPDRIEKQIMWMETHPDYGICGTNAWYITESGRKVRKSHLPTDNEEINRAKYYKSPFFHPSVIMLRDIAVTYKYNEDYFLSQDYELWLRILREHKGYNLKETLLLYRLPTSISKSKRDERNELHVKIFEENLTSQNTSLSEKYVYGFLSGKKINMDNDFDELISELFYQIKDSNGFNFYILLRHFKFYFKNKRIDIFIKHLPIKEHIKFCGKFMFYIAEFTLSSIKKKI